MGAYFDPGALDLGAGESALSRFTGEATFSFAGLDWKVTFSDRAFIEAEGVLHQSMAEWVPEIDLAIKSGRQIQMRHVAAILYGGLRINHPLISEDEVMAMVRSGDQGVMGAFIRAFEAAIPTEADMDDADPEVVGNAPAKPVETNRKARRATKGKSKAGTGTKSTGSGSRRASRRKPS